MASDIHMTEALSAILYKGETLMHPIFGTVTRGEVQLFAYFAFTETHFLIAYLTSGDRITGTERIPLDIKSVKIKKTKLIDDYKINLLFENNRALEISAFPWVLKIKSQKDNFPLFVKHLQSVAKKEAQEPKNISGEKIRWQYFNTYIYIMLSFMPTIDVMIIVDELKKGTSDLLTILTDVSKATPELLAVFGLFIGPFIVLSIFNRFFFGRVLATVNGETLFLEGRDIPLREIKEIVYHPRVISRRRLNFSYATLVLYSKNKNTESLDVVHFPLYGLRKIKKYNKSIKLRCDKYVWFLILSPTVIAIIIPLLAG